jgi:cellulose biosynthesis protein BcsQ
MEKIAPSKPGIKQPVPLPAIVDEADFMLPPSQPSPADLNATAPIRRLWQNTETPAAVVLNGVTRENATRTRGYLNRYAGIGKILPTAIVRRVQYVDALEAGLGVSEYLPGGAGDQEMCKLLDSMFSQAAARTAAMQ